MSNKSGVYVIALACLLVIACIKFYDDILFDVYVPAKKSFKLAENSREMSRLTKALLDYKNSSIANSLQMVDAFKDNHKRVVNNLTGNKAFVFFVAPIRVGKLCNKYEINIVDGFTINLF